MWPSVDVTMHYIQSQQLASCLTEAHAARKTFTIFIKMSEMNGKFLLGCVGCVAACTSHRNQLGTDHTLHIFRWKKYLSKTTFDRYWRNSTGGREGGTSFSTEWRHMTVCGFFSSLLLSGIDHRLLVAAGIGCFTGIRDKLHRRHLTVLSPLRLLKHGDAQQTSVWDLRRECLRVDMEVFESYYGNVWGFTYRSFWDWIW